MPVNTIQTVKEVTHSQAADILAALGIELAQGETREIDVSLCLRGNIQRGFDTESAATVKVLSLATLGCVLRHCGITREAAIETAFRAIKEGKTAISQEDLAFVETLKARIANELPPIQVEGRRTGKLAVIH